MGLSSNTRGDLGREGGTGSELDRIFEKDMTFRLGVLRKGSQQTFVKRGRWEFHTIAAGAALDEPGAGDSVLPKGGKAEEAEPGLRAEACRSTGESIFRSLPGGLMEPGTAAVCECVTGLRGIGYGDVRLLPL